MPRKVWWLVLFFLLGLSVIAWTRRSGLPVQTALVARGTIRAYVDEQAKTRLPRTYEISMPFAGRLAPITLREGDRVTAGQEVARLVPNEIDEEVAAAQAAVARLAARIVENDDVTVERIAQQQAELFVESMQSTVAAAEAQQTAGKEQLNYAETFLGRVRNLLASGASSRDEVDRAELTFIENQVDYRQDVLITEALQAVQAATNLLPRMITETIGRKILSRNVLLQEQREAEARLREALLRQQRSVMHSPVEGIILAREVIQEQFVAAGTLLLRIGQLEELEVETELLTEDVATVRVGDRTWIYGPAVGGGVDEAVEGRVERIYPAGFTKISSLGVEQQRVTVIVRFAEGVLPRLLTAYQLGVDYRVRVRIVTDEAAGVLLIPRSALFHGPQEQWQVFVVQDDRAVRRDVAVGLLNDALAEIRSGLNESDRVIVAPESAIEDGTRVTVEPSSASPVPRAVAGEWSRHQRGGTGCA